MSLLRYVGSKKWFSNYRGGEILLEHLENRGGRYFEPFLGGGSMAFFLGARLDNPLLLSDAVEPLIEFYRALKERPGELAGAVDLIGSEYGLDEQAYYAVRAEEPEDPLYRAARFLYLNRSCFNGIWRENASGKMNTPAGSAAKAGRTKLPTCNELEDYSRMLRTAEFECCDFELAINMAGPYDVLYVDPPYYDTFTDYSKGGFGVKDQERLALALYRAGQRGATFLAHNSYQDSLATSPEEAGVRYWYSDFATIIPIDEPRTVSANGDRTKAPCALITNDPLLAEKLR